VAERLGVVAAAWPATAERRHLDLRRRRFAAGLLARSVAAEAVWTAAATVARVAGQEGRVRARRQRAQEGRRMASIALRRRDDSPESLSSR
jgi:hypothetical protein